jgi:hypothetical protein
LLDDMERHAQPRQVVGQDVRRKTRLLLVEIHGDQVEIHRRVAPQAQEHIEQRVGVLAAGQAHHDPIARGDHAEVRNGLARGAAQLRFQLLEIVRGPELRSSRAGGAHGASRYLASK